jgi:hypothetical protein
MNPDTTSINRLRLDRSLARCVGSTPALREALRSLQPTEAATLNRILETLLAEASRSTSSAWIRGCIAGQQIHM